MATKVERPEPVPEMKEPEQPADMEIEVAGEDDDDLYTRLKTLQRQLEFFEIQARALAAHTRRAWPWHAGQLRSGLLHTRHLRQLLSAGAARDFRARSFPPVLPLTTFQSCVQEEYIKEEQRNLKRELLRAQEEVKRIQSVPLVIGQFLEMVDTASGIVGSTTGSNYYVRILSTLNRELLKPSASVALHRHSNALVDILPPEADSSISLLSQSERPDVTYQARKARVSG